MSAVPAYQHFTLDTIEFVRALGVTGTTPWHSHKRLLVGRIDRGQRTVKLRGGALSLTEGQGFVLPPGLAHRIIADAPTDYRVICFPVSAGIGGTAAAALAGQDWALVFERAFASAMHGQRDGLSDLLAATLPVAPPAATELLPRAVRRLSRDIASRPEHSARLDDMAHQSGLSPFHLQRQFVRATGLSPRQARLGERLHRARALLMSGMPAGEAAVACGFADQAHLSREFSKWTGLPPGRYLRQISHRR